MVDSSNDNLNTDQLTPEEEQQTDELLDPRKGLLFWTMRFLKGIFYSEKKIGEMNGKWAALFRVVLILLFLGVPSLGAWAMWVTRSAWDSQNHRETTVQFEERIDMLERQSMILERVDKSVQEINTDLKSRPSPKVVQDQVRANADAVKSVADSVSRLDKANTDQHNKIYTELGDKVNKIENENTKDHAVMKTALEFIKEQVSKK